MLYSNNNLTLYFQQLQLATKVYTDSLYNFEILRMVQHHLQTFNSTVYVYQFNYRGVLSMTSKDIDNNQNVGVDDGDTLIYLFPIPGEYFRQNGMTRSSADMKYVDIMVDFFTSFMIEGYAISSFIFGILYANPKMILICLTENLLLVITLLTCGNLS